MSRIKVDRITDRAGTGEPLFPNGVKVVGLTSLSNVIAGVATGAIGISMLVADKLKLPFIYVRPEPKKHGKKNQIEGHLNSKLPVLVIEDLVSTGKSSLNAINALKSNGYNVIGMLSIFSYNFEFANKKFVSEKITINSEFVKNNLGNLVKDTDLSKFIL